MARLPVLVLAVVTLGVGVAACNASQPNNNTPSPTKTGPTPTPTPQGASNCTNGSADFGQLSGGPGLSVFQGVESNTTGNWTATVTTSASGVITQITVQDASIQGNVTSAWTFTFSAVELTPPYLSVGNFFNAQGVGGGTPGEAALSITADGQACNVISGSFQIGVLATNATGLLGFQASFSQECNGSASNVLKGCVNWHF